MFLDGGVLACVFSLGWIFAVSPFIGALCFLASNALLPAQTLPDTCPQFRLPHGPGRATRPAFEIRPHGRSHAHTTARPPLKKCFPRSSVLAVGAYLFGITQPAMILGEIYKRRGGRVFIGWTDFLISAQVPPP